MVPQLSAEATPAPSITGGPEAWLDRVRAGRANDPVTHVERIPARPGVVVDWPTWAPQPLRDAFAARGVTRPWAHQVEAAEAAAAGESVVVATGTASGKSLAYQLPTLTALLADDRATALYLSPTKALAADQLRGLLDIPGGIRPALYDGDTPDTEREWVRAHSRLVLTNPDMLHRGILPRHDMWASFFRRLRFVVVDECHAYRGVFGSHVAHVLRRLRRICARYRSAPVFVLASATVADPAGSAGALIGAPVRAVTDDASPRGATTFALWEPPVSPVVGERGAPTRRTATAEAADLLADLVSVGARTLAFVRSRRGAEAVALGAKRALAEAVPELVEQVAAYRAGYLADDRRELEAALRSGELLGLASTNALELGVDVTGLDAVVLTGYPGRIASLWQQAGRAGRGSRDALAVLVARDDPLDSYLVHHPGAVFGRPVEATVLDPSNPYVLGPQLACAASELPLTEADLPLFGGDAARAALEGLVAAGVLRRRPAGWYWTSRGRPDADLRGTGGEPVSIVEAATGRLLGTVDAGSAPSSVHTGAVHLHRGETFVVEELDLDNLVALVRRAEPDWYTQSRDVTDLDVVSVEQRVEVDGVQLCFGTVDVTNQVVSFLRRRIVTGEVLDEQPLDLPPQQLRTRAVWYTLDESVLAEAELEELDVAGSAHAAEHAAIGLLPLVASCDRWDIGGLSTASHQDTGLATVFVYDGHPGGAGFAERGFAAAVDWLAATRDAIADCDCAAGCPSCVHSPKCGNGNDPLDKAGAVRLLTAVVDRVRRAAVQQSTFGLQVGGSHPR
ncbi:DEAD/DEAH box helicase [Cryptosporangium aurantiacum]|uniref:DEAD/DEAH box helicase domain-containing protein n=1 Tax=Cryptosporangium aurantiacum TaxID=134849 RepID=A0A1M7NGK5_9ACTN|nr:DEAD/DEAH box helicase [Cryptosporangium aurantiacum]SHN02573.1 DEAD/DEAH box helicase domain-containing protein [Cryptosporangium aurantiacum]